jgi:hypothetical protein
MQIADGTVKGNERSKDKRQREAKYVQVRTKYLHKLTNHFKANLCVPETFVIEKMHVSNLAVSALLLILFCCLICLP